MKLLESSNSYFDKNQEMMDFPVDYVIILLLFLKIKCLLLKAE